MSNAYAYLRMAAPFAVLLLSACGGGGGGGPKPLPVVPTPTPTPAPDPEFPLKASAAFNTIHANRSYRDTRTGVVEEFGATGRSSKLTIEYDHTTGTYTVRDGASSAIFSASDRSSSGGHIDVYTKDSGSVTDKLRLFNNVRVGTSQTSAPVKLTYLSYGIWSHDNANSGEHRDAYFLFGYPTATSDMPRMGTATYSTFVTGNYVSIFGAQGESEVGGSATFNADFGAGTVNTDLTLQVVGSPNPFGTYLGAARIGGNQFFGQFTSSDPWFVSGSFAGGFFGPNAKEMGYTFAIKRGSPDPYAYAGPAPPLSWTVGTVVGRKDGP